MAILRFPPAPDWPADLAKREAEWDQDEPPQPKKGYSMNQLLCDMLALAAGAILMVWFILVLAGVW